MRLDRPSRDRAGSRGWLLAAVWLLSLLSAGAQPVVLHLRNGDRLTGTILREETNQITLQTTWWNVVVVPAGEIKNREALPAAPAQPPGAVAPKPPAAPPVGTVVVAPPIAPKRPKEWAGELQFGTDLLFSEKNRQLYSTRAKLTYAHDHFRNLLDYDFAYGRTEGVVSDNRMFGTLKTDYDLTPRVYLYNLGGAGYDLIRQIDLRYEIGPGVGYRLLKLTNLVLNTEAGFNYQAQFLTDDGSLESFYLRWAQDLTWQLHARVSLDEKFEIFSRFENWGQYRLRFEANLRFAVFSYFSLLLTVLDQYDTTLAAGVPQNDLQIRSSVGVKF